MKTSAPALRLFFFWSGIIATFAYRVIIVLNFYSPVWVQAAWYVGTIGFIVYFAHRYLVTERRAKMIEEHGLLRKVESLPIDSHDREVMRYVFESLSTSKEKWNYIVIFGLSGIALIIGLIMDFIV
ncbi:MAG: hypothetical protein WC505_01485 [Patescibacteria group bacterium]